MFDEGVGNKTSAAGDENRFVVYHKFTGYLQFE
jgi:hypothetical protein